jgi:hypothetical protein
MIKEQDIYRSLQTHQVRCEWDFKELLVELHRPRRQTRLQRPMS